MKENYTHISVVLDRSGSMARIRQDTIGGFNTFLNGQKKESSEATFSSVQFDHDFKVLNSFTPINEVVELTDETFIPRGNTALYDAIGRSIVECGEKLSEMNEDDRPDKVIFVIITDGYENASMEYSQAKVHQMIKHQTDTYGWLFMFLGANIDAVKTGTSLGIDRDFSSDFGANSRGVNSSFENLSCKMSGMRKSAGPLYTNGHMTAVASSQVYTKGDRARQI